VFNLYYRVHLAIFLALFCQASSQESVNELIEALRSSKIQERDRAAGTLRKLAGAAIPALEQSSKSSDQELSARSRYLLRVIAIDAKIAPRLLVALDGVVDRLATGNDHTWTDVFLDAARIARGRAPHPLLDKSDLEKLVVPALRGASKADEKIQLCDEIARWDLQVARANVKDLLEDSNPSVIAAAVGVLGALGAKEDASLLRAFLSRNDVGILYRTIDSLGRLSATEAVPDLLAFLELKDPPLQFIVLQSLGNLGAEQASDAALTLFRSDQGYVSGAAARALGDIGVKAVVPEFIERLKTADTNLRLDIIEAIRTLRAKEAIPPLRALLAASDYRVRTAAASALCELGSYDGVAQLLSDTAKIDSQRWESVKPTTNLTSLNALRDPDTWSVLSNQKLIGRRVGTIQELIEGLAGTANMRIVWPKPPVSKVESILQVRSEVLNQGGRRTLIDALHCRKLDDHEIVLEKSCVSILSHDEAVLFWKEWWNRTKK
jgi:HEAT repeat protein